MKARKPDNEAERLETLRSYSILDTPPEMSYDDLVLLASEACRMPIAAISLVDADRQWFKSIVGLEVKQTSRDVAFCAHAILDTERPLVVENATQDPRFSDNALVTGDPGIRFYAGTPLVMSDGNPIGTLCVIDFEPRDLTPAQLRTLEVLGREVAAQLELRRHVFKLERTVVKLARKEAELKQVQQAQLDLKDQFVSHVSHELRSPLTPIYQFATILRDGIAGPLSGEQKEYVEIMVRNAEQLRGMIDDLLTVTRAQTGKLSVFRRRIRVEDVVNDLVGSLNVTAADAGLTLTADVAPDLPEVLGDAGRVRQVLANLIENAVKFTDPGGTIEVRVAERPEEPGAVCVTVADSGRGMAPEACEHVFEQLYQVEAGDHITRNGLGLGLYISKELIRRQGGEIWVESREGEGSRFSFTLPVFDLGELLAPVLTPANLEHGGATLITIALVATAEGAPGAIAERAMDEAWEAVVHSVHPAMDVVLPRFGNPDQGETIVVAAMADPAGAERIVARLHEQLERCDAVRGGGHEVRIQHLNVTLPEATDPEDPHARTKEIVRMLDAHVAHIYNEGVV